VTECIEINNASEFNKQFTNKLTYCCCCYCYLCISYFDTRYCIYTAAACSEGIMSSPCLSVQLAVLMSVQCQHRLACHFKHDKPHSFKVIKKIASTINRFESVSVTVINKKTLLELE